MDGAGRLTGELLKDDGTQQVLEWGAPSLDHQRLTVVSGDHPSQRGVYLAQVLDTGIPELRDDPGFSGRQDGPLSSC